MLANYEDIYLSPEQAEADLGIPSMALLPMISQEGLRLIKDVSAFSPLMESYRTFRTNVYFATLDRPARTLLVTSSVPSEGKSTTVANLAMAMAMDNKRVVLVDADLRRPNLHKIYNVNPCPGLTDVLTGRNTLAEALRETTSPLVKLLPAGSPPPNPAELLGSPAFLALLDELKSCSDIVLFDSPPVLAVVDGVMLAHRVDATVLVIGAGETIKRNIRKSMEVLTRARANVIGTAINRVSGAVGGYYYGKYYVSTETPEENDTENPVPADAIEDTAESAKDPEKTSVRRRRTQKLTVEQATQAVNELDDRSFAALLTAVQGRLDQAGQQ